MLRMHDKSCPNRYSPDLFDPDCHLLKDILRPPNDRLIFCIDESVNTLYRQRMEDWLTAHNMSAAWIVIPGGEQAKALSTWEQILQEMWEHNPLRRSEPVIAIGGGAVTDTVGFAAAAWRRATPWIRIPTTLLGMVDASVGIKVRTLLFVCLLSCLLWH